MNTQDELALLARARALEPEALTEVHQTYYRPIFRYISFRVTDQKVTEDLTSEVFTRLLSALRDKSAPQNTLRGWLYGVASRVVSDHFRQMNRAEEVALSDMLPDKQASLEEKMSQKLSAEALREALHHLTEEQQRVLALRFGLGMRIREVAETMGKSEGSIKQLQLRAIASLARQLPVGVDVI